MKKEEILGMLPLNIQFFADPAKPTEPAGAEEPPKGDEPTGGTEPTEPATPSVEELLVQNKQSNAQLAKTKNALDKALKQLGEMTKKVHSMQTADEQEADAKKEAEEKHQEYVKGLESKLAMIEARARYTEMGMDADLAEATAKAELEGDRDTITANIRKAMDATVKAKEAEWLKTRPAPQGGNGEGDGKEDPFLAGFNS